jgi:hypothetical protein
MKTEKWIEEKTYVAEEQEKLVSSEKYRRNHFYKDNLPQ